MPVTFSPDSVSEADRIVEAVRYPCLLKPRLPVITGTRDRKKVIVIHSSRQLRSHYERLFDQEYPFLIQEIIPGPDTGLFGYLALWSEDARELAWFAKQKLRQYPPGYGDGSLQISVEAPQVVKQGRQLMRALEYSGFVGIEFKYDERDGTYRFIEINLRTVSGNQLAISSGVDFPWIGYQYLIGDGPVVPSPPIPQVGIKYLQEAWDFRAFLLLRKRRKITLARWLQSLRKVQAKALWAKDDLLPILHVVWHGLRDEVRRIRHYPAC
jgi:predicted ATP-grasp superfamily ATP-dependent carboligase